MSLYSCNPTSEDPMVWYVWDIYQSLPPKPVFFGTMEDAGLVADALNGRLQMVDFTKPDLAKRTTCK